MLSSSKFSIFSLIVSSGDPFEQLNSRHSLQTSEHTKPFLRQTHLFVLQSPLHPHRIILSRSSGAIGLSMKTGQSIWSSLSYHPQSVETNSWVSRAIHVWTCRKTRMLCWWQAAVVSGNLKLQFVRCVTCLNLEKNTHAVLIASCRCEWQTWSFNLCDEWHWSNLCLEFL